MPSLTEKAVDDEVADKVLAALKSMGAYGRLRARPQAEVARQMGVTTRRLQQATLSLNLRGLPVVSTCSQPPGVYIAEKYDEFDDYIRQLDHRIRGVAIRLREVRRIRRQWEAAETVEPSGQRRLFR